MRTEFSARYGFARRDVTLANWRTSPYSRWSFQNLREIVPCAVITHPGSRTETVAARTDEILRLALPSDRDDVSTVADFLEASDTDVFVVMHKGVVVAECTGRHADADAPHVVFSVSKSLTALLFAVLEGQGLLDAKAAVVSVLPEAAGSAYGDSRLRDVLDMRVSLAFDEAYLDPSGVYARYRRSTLWNPPQLGAPAENLAQLLMSLAKGPGPHGGPFAYASPNSDLLGIVIERASGGRFAELMRAHVFEPIGATGAAEVTVDAIGTARAAGGISLTARDLARVGEMLRCGGAANGRQVVPEAWLADMLSAGDARAYAQGSSGAMPNGRYRSQWYQTGEADGAFCAIGIHGQWLYVDPSREAVFVKLSSQPNPLDDEMKLDVLAFFRTLAQRLG